MKTTLTKRILSIIAVISLLLAFGLFAIASSDSEGSSDDQGSGDASSDSGKDSNIYYYNVNIKSCRLAKDYSGNPIAIITYTFTNNAEDATCFMYAFNDAVYQNGVGLNKCYLTSDTANYSSENQTKQNKTGATLDVEFAYVLNDETTDLEVEVKRLIDFFDKDEMITKTFKIAK